MYGDIYITDDENEEESIYVRRKDLIEIDKDLICIRSSEELAGKAIFLPKTINGISVRWHLVRDSLDIICVVPVRSVS